MIRLSKLVSEYGVVKMIDTKSVHGNMNGITNPSILKHNGKAFMSFRSTSYTFISYRFFNQGDRNIVYYPENRADIPVQFSSSNYVCDFDTNTLCVSEPKEILTDYNKDGNELYRGYEDVRLFTDGDRIMTSASVFSDWKHIDMTVGTVDGSTSARNKFNISGVEKNWMPVLGRPNVFVHTVPNVVVDVSDGEVRFLRDGDRGMVYSGSTQLHPYKDGYISVCHKKLIDSCVKSMGWGYFHKFIYWNSNLEIERESDWFTFAAFPIEFTCGILIDGNDVILPFSVFDNISFVMKFDVSLIDHLLYGVEIVKRDFGSNLLNDALRMNDDESVVEVVCSHIINSSDEPAGRVACECYLATFAPKQTALDLYTRGLCDVKRINIRHKNHYPQALVTQDLIRNQIAVLLDW